MRFFILLLPSVLLACAAPPVLPGTVDRAAQDAPYPVLVSLDPILAQSAAMQTTLDPGQSVIARAAALRQRAAALQRPVIDPATKSRMQAGIGTAALQ